MTERKIGEEFSDSWDGHHPKDDCPENGYKIGLKGYLTLPVVFPRLLGELYGNMLKRDRELLSELREFLASRPQFPLKRITEGQKFDPNEYQPKTIMTISRNRSFGKDTYHQSMWAITSLEWGPDMGDKNVVVGFANESIRSGSLGGEMGNRNWHSSFVVGEVIHDRETNFPFGQRNTFSRYGIVEIWKFGLAESAKNPTFSPALKPSTQKG